MQTPVRAEIDLHRPKMGPNSPNEQPIVSFILLETVLSCFKWVKTVVRFTVNPIWMVDGASSFEEMNVGMREV